jgi:hypothetical protein
MTGRKAISRAELTDDETATVLAEARAGRRLSRRAARQLATSLRRVTGALPPGTGNLAGLSRRLTSAANVLEAQATAPPNATPETYARTTTHRTSTERPTGGLGGPVIQGAYLAPRLLGVVCPNDRSNSD